jgi:hypothetical protein
MVVDRSSVRHPGFIIAPLLVGSVTISPFDPSPPMFVKSMVAISTPRLGMIEILLEFFSACAASSIILPLPSSTRPSVLNTT